MGGSDQQQQLRGRFSSTSGSRIDTGDFTERRGDTDNDSRHKDPTPDNVNRATSNERVVECSSETVGDRGKDEGHEGDLEG